MRSIDRSKALAWRLGRQLLDPVGSVSVEGVVRRLGAVAAQSETASELAIGLRRQEPRHGDLARALADGRVIKTFAFRGATHFMTPEDGGVYLALRAASRMWELPSWQTYYDLKPADWPAFREAVRDDLAAGPLTRDELEAALRARPRYRRLELTYTLLKALAWQGDLAFGPSRDGQATFERLDRNPRWAGIPDLDDAGVRAVEAYLTAYGPATPAHLKYWLGEGLGAGRKRIRGWIAALGERLVEVDVEGDAEYVLREDLEELVSTGASAAVRLLPAYDQWLLGPGTADAHIVPPDQRALVSRGANVVIVGGVVSGTWTLTNDELTTSWFARGQRPAPEAVTAEIARLASILDRHIEWSAR